jgi:hypothetical protein
MAYVRLQDWTFHLPWNSWVSCVGFYVVYYATSIMLCLLKRKGLYKKISLKTQNQVIASQILRQDDVCVSDAFHS